MNEEHINWNTVANKLTIILMSMSLIGAAYTPPAEAGVVGDSQWQVGKGDTVYSIARKMFPDNRAKQVRFRQELVKSNPDIFKGNANLMSIGTLLQLPGFAITKPEQVVAPVVSTSEQEPEPEPVEPVAAAIPDPADIVGKVVVSAGTMQADNRGTLRKLLRNSKIFKGDTLITERNSYTQVRMKDGALISLRPNTKLLIADYNFNGSEDGSEKSVMQLISGGFRTITGLIGHKNKANYRVRTSVATIGIRGTHYGLMLCDAGSCDDEETSLQDGLYGGVVDGSVAISNDSGEFIFDNDQFFHVASDNSVPVEQLRPPPVFHGKDDKKRIARVDGERVEKIKEKLNGLPEKIKENGTIDDNRGKVREFIATQGGAPRLPPQIIGDFQPPTLPIPNDQDANPINNDPTINTAPDGAGMLISFVGLDQVTGTLDNTAVGVLVGANTVNEIVLGSRTDSTTGGTINNIPIAGQEVSNGQQHTLILPSGAAAVTDIGGNTLGVNWGRWSSNYVLTENGVPLPTSGNLHYIYSDRLTTPNEMAPLTALGGLMMQTYTYLDGTRPTNSEGLLGTLGGITVSTDFNARTIDYHIQVNDASGANFDLSTMMPVSFSSMNEFNLVDTGVALGSVPICTVACQGRASAAFVGPQAEGMITSYSVGEVNGGPKGANGTALLIRGGVTIPPPPPQQ